MNTELIKALRWCGDESDEWCVREEYKCPLWNEDRITDECKAELMRDAADALEAAEQRIEDLEKSYSWKAYAALEESIEGYKTRIAKLEAQLPKEGEWIEVHDWLQIPQEERGTYRCSACGQVMKYTWNHCPNCGARMNHKYCDVVRRGKEQADE